MFVFRLFFTHQTLMNAALDLAKMEAHASTASTSSPAPVIPDLVEMNVQFVSLCRINLTFINFPERKYMKPKQNMDKLTQTQ